jgi:hypothetical protein
VDSILLIFLVLNIVNIITIKDNRKIITEFKSIIIKEQIENKNKNDILFNSMKFQLMLNNSLKQYACETLFMNNRKVLLLFNDKGCKQCVLSLIMDLNILAEKIGGENVILAGNFSNKKALNKYLHFMNDGFKSILLKDIFNTETIKIDKPTLLLLEPDCRTELVFYNPDGVQSIKDIYYDELVKVYNDEYTNK